MQRLIQDTIRRALADELLFGRLVHGGKVLVDVDSQSQVVLDFPDDPPSSGSVPSPSHPEPELVD
jgi:ATP-dependent Clp protease ATP-binding subunit ClpA